MKSTCIIALVLCSTTSILGRFVTKDFDNIDDQNDPSRTLKGVLKFYKDQPRVTDSESLEFDEVSETIPLVTQSVNNEDSKLSQQNNSPQTVVIETKSVHDVESETTISSLGVEGTADIQSLSKSDLYGDEMDDIDECVEGDVMKVSCNTCVCSDGRYFCSKRSCNEKDKPLPPIEKSSSKRKGGIIKYHSVKGDSSTTERVGNATDEASSQSGNATTTTFIISEVDTAQCIDGRTKPVDCNQCICALGKWACTKMSCIALSLREKASYSGDAFLNSVGTLKEHTTIDEDCMEGDAKQMGCNQCVCHMNSWACSNLSCPSTPAPPIAEIVQESCQTEEDVKSKDCNICSCRRGVWVCTENDCKKFGNRYFHPVSQKNQNNDSDQES